MYNNIPFIFYGFRPWIRTESPRAGPETTVAGTERRARGVIFCPTAPVRLSYTTNLFIIDIIIIIRIRL